ncbi:hypothetical protein [Iodobacter ciconiae]|uniref:Uncharacterized protein n=1 Tax=Iodobacter ciconiae TaxID=2496266 RepID=A0A3S8ZTM6_9NEIS|nr:hypothetical protein [Iodobacter ciconiae]AZN36822.1 hypothetical protein EJO50_10215 [Iodobacter ciconiae]
MNLIFVWTIILIPGLTINLIIHKWCLKKQTKKSSEIWLLIFNGIFFSPFIGLIIFSNSNGGYGAGLAAVLIPLVNTGLSILLIFYVALSNRPEPEMHPSSSANFKTDQ